MASMNTEPILFRDLPRINKNLHTRRHEKWGRKQRGEALGIVAKKAKTGGEGGIRTLDRGYPLCRLSKPVHESSKHNNNKVLYEHKTPRDTHRDTFSEINALPLPSDLAPIAAAWSSIPEPIKVAVKAVVAPYLGKEGDA